jgi:dihydropteroate synthase
MFAWGSRTYVMGIVNVTPDSFSGDGRMETQAAVAHAAGQLEEGADLLDIGAASSRPGHVPIDVEEEKRRLLPVLRGVRTRAPDAVLSVDTFKAEVFAAAHAAGATMLNSIWGLDDALAEAVLACGVPVVIMHNKSDASYERDVVDEVLSYLEERAARAVRAGIPPQRIILDPGIGFGKRVEHNIALLRALRRIVALGFPTLLGASRKSVIGALTGKPVEDRVYGTAAVTALAIAAGIDVVRVHDVAATRDVVRVADAVARVKEPPIGGS